MAISIDWGYTKVIYVPKSFMSVIQTVPFEIRELDLNLFRIALKNEEDSEPGMAAPHTHTHNTIVTVGGVTLARVIEILAPYTVTFEDGQYAVSLVGANSNVADVTNLNMVQIRSANSAGMIQVTSGSGLSSEEHNKLMSVPTVPEIADGVLTESVDDHKLVDGSVANVLDKTKKNAGLIPGLV